MIDGARRAGMTISTTAYLLKYSHTSVSKIYSEFCVNGDTLLMREVSGKSPDWFELTKSYSTSDNQSVQFF